MSDAKDSLLYRMVSFGTECFQIFLGAFSVGVSSAVFFPGVLPRSMKDGVLVYDLLITGNEDESVVLHVLDQGLGHFFSRNRMLLRISGEKNIVLRAEEYFGICAYIRIMKEGWKLYVPPNLLMGPSYMEAEARWDAIAREISRTLSEKYR